jgi:ribosomal protein S18 acetylase RimI-like enzyme
VSAYSIRTRTAADLDACVAVAEQVRALDGYPTFVGDDGLARFVDPDDALAAWVAVDDADGVVGMVALRPRSAPQSSVIAAKALEVGEDQLGFVARLEVAPRARRQGVAHALLDAAVATGRQLGRVLVLDVVTSDTSAIALYDASGWRRLGGHSLTLRDGRELDVVVYAAPEDR